MAYNKVEPLKNIVVFDIETIPDTTLAGELCEISNEDLKNKTQDDLRKEMEYYHTDKHNNPFLRQPFHRIACISFLKASIAYDNEYADDMSNVGKESYNFEQLTSYSSFNCSEKEVVEKFWHTLKESKPRIISFNGRDFDINVMKCKALFQAIFSQNLLRKRIPMITVN